MAKTTQSVKQNSEATQLQQNEHFVKQIVTQGFEDEPARGAKHLN